MWAEELARTSSQVRNASTWNLLESLACARVCLVELGGIWNMFFASRNAQLRLLNSKYIKTWKGEWNVCQEI